MMIGVCFGASFAAELTYHSVVLSPSSLLSGSRKLGQASQFTVRALSAETIHADLPDNIWIQQLMMSSRSPQEDQHYALEG